MLNGLKVDAGRLVYLDQALSLTQEMSRRLQSLKNYRNHWSIALDDYVAALSQWDNSSLNLNILENR